MFSDVDFVFIREITDSSSSSVSLWFRQLSYFLIVLFAGLLASKLPRPGDRQLHQNQDWNVSSPQAQRITSGVDLQKLCHKSLYVGFVSSTDLCSEIETMDPSEFFANELAEKSGWAVHLKKS